MDEILNLFKMDLGIKSTSRDAYFTSLLTAGKNELIEKGINIDLTVLDDQLLVADYTAWKYRNRQNDVGLSKNLRLRINNRILKARSTYESEL